MPTPGPLPSSYWVLENQLLAGPYPGSPDDEEARERVGRLLDAGVRVFIDLTQGDELLPYEPSLQEESAARGIAVEHIRAPIRDLGVPTEEELAETLDRIDCALRAGRQVYVHCWGGIGRTGTVIGCWLSQQGYAAKAALDRLAELRDGCDPYRRLSPETGAQREMVRGWKRGRSE